MSSEGFLSVLGKLYKEYTTKTPKKLKLVDVYLSYIMATGIIQFIYCLLVGTFPFNSFLSGFISCVGSFVLAGKILNIAHKSIKHEQVNQIAVMMTITTFIIFCHAFAYVSIAVCLRIQSNPQNKTFFNISPERAFADFIFASAVLHLVVFNFIG